MNHGCLNIYDEPHNDKKMFAEKPMPMQLLLSIAKMIDDGKSCNACDVLLTLAENLAVLVDEFREGPSLSHYQGIAQC